MFQGFRRDPKTYLLYRQNDEHKRLYIPYKCRAKVLSIVHDNRVYTRANRVYDYLYKLIYFLYIKREILLYISNYPIYNISRLKRNLPWGNLDLIEYLLYLLLVLCFNFIDRLPLSRNGNNKVFIITYKGSKYVK
jgi:hypothetical protein